MLFRNAMTASKNVNFIDFNDSNTSSVFPIFHTRKHDKPDDENQKKPEKFEEILNNFAPEECAVVGHLD